LLVLLVTAAIGLLVGLPVWWVARHARVVDVAAPRLQPAAVTEEVASQAQRHRWVRAWISRRTDPTVVTGSLLTAAVAVIVLGLGGVGVLLAMVRTKRGFADFDMSAARFGASHASVLSTHLLRVVTQLGGAMVIVPAAVVLAVVEMRRQRTVAVAAFLAVAVGGQFLVANLVKTMVGRVRPDISRLTGFSGTSFPSGHATAAAAGFAAAALVLGRGRPRSVKAVLAGVSVGMAAVIATSRVLLGVHWLTDVMAGLCLGWGWFALCSIAFGGLLLRFGAPVAAAEDAVDVVNDARRPDDLHAPL